MYTVITGPPGIGKTARLLQVAHSTKRPVFHNIDGFKSGYRFDGKDGKSVVPLHPCYFFRMSTHEMKGNCRDSVFLVDEAHLFFRDFYREVDITGFIESHCAYDVDIYIALQSTCLLNPFFLPEEYRQEVYFYSRYNGFFSFFGQTPYSVFSCRRTSSGIHRTLEKPLGFRRFRFFPDLNDSNIFL